MKAPKSAYKVTVVSMALLLFTSLASAQSTRTWVSGVGDDANPCSRTAPCKTWAGAISKTAPAGEIDALDPGGFGAVTITKSITLDGGGGQVASILVAGTNGIIIAAGAADVVTIRNIRLDGIGAGVGSGSPGLAGINITSAKAVHLEHDTIFGFSTAGVQINASASVALTMSDVSILDIAGPGVNVTTSAGTATADIKDVRIANCVTGVQGATNSQINVINSQISGSSGAALQSTAGVIRAFSNFISSNATAFSPVGGTIFTDGLNTLAGNTINGTTNGGLVGKQ